MPKVSDVAKPVAHSPRENGIEPVKKMNHSVTKLAIFFCVGIIAIIAGATTGAFWNSIFNHIFKNAFTLSPTSKSYELWEETPIPMYLKFHFFNMTNPEEFSSELGKKPSFIEMGPYVFREMDYKVNQTWNDNGTISFYRRKVWFFEESMSNGSLSDQVTNLNPIAATVGYSSRFKPDLLKELIEKIMVGLGEKLTTTKTVRELLFDGYNDTMLEIAQKFKASNIPFNKFGWFYSRNNSDTYEGMYNILTGIHGLTSLGELKEWKYSNRYKKYYSSCGKITGSLGDLWPPLVDNKTVSIFVPDICTKIDLVYKNVTTSQGLEGWQYIGDSTMLDNGTSVPSRSCYCHNVECSPSGTLNVSSCLYDAPAFFSMPHFYLADPVYRDAVVGMNPSKEKHETSIILEPTTGVPLEVRAQMQVNLLVQPDAKMKMFKYLSKTYVPMLWFTQEAYLTPNLASQVKVLLILPLLGHVTLFGIAAIGALIFLIGVFICVRQKWKGEEGQVLLTKNESNNIVRDNHT